MTVPFFEWSHGIIYHGDARRVLPHLAEKSVDAIVTDPPYEIAFMGKAWDSTGVAYDVELWRECLRVLKPGAYLLAFGGARTYHRMACAVEDAGFEVRDQIMWLYGSGFPKSLDVAKAIDKALGRESERSFRCANPAARPGNAGSGIAGETATTSSGWRKPVRPDKTNPATHEARQWEGWGTALKPAHEPIVVARKPFKGTVAGNVLEHGTGALNIDGCRIPTEESLTGGAAPPFAFQGDNARPFHSRGREGEASSDRRYADRGATDFAARPGPRGGDARGRWPANVMHDGSDEVLAAFARYGDDKGAAAPVTVRNGDKFRTAYGSFAGNRDEEGSTFHGDAGSAARFFYCAKASREDRDRGCESLDKQPLNWSSGTESPGTFQSAGTDRSARNNHPTVKPTELMRYLCRLVTPPGGVVLDPLMGSGSTGKAAILEGLRFVGIDTDLRACQIAERRTREMTFMWPADSSAAEGGRAEE